MPIIGSFGAGSATGFGQRRGGAAPQTFDYMFIAGGGGGYNGGSGAGAGGGGFRTNHPGGTQIELTGGVAYTVTVGAGGSKDTPIGGKGGDSEIYISAPSVDFESTGGGGGGGGGPQADGGSGGGSYSSTAAGSGNTPPLSSPAAPVQGNPGGQGPGPGHTGGGGGGAGAAGNNNGNGGSGSTVNITGSPFTAAGGGGGGYYSSSPPGGGSGGSGGGGTGRLSGNDGTDGLGGGGGGGGRAHAPQPPNSGGDGGNGIIYFRYPNSDDDPAVTPGSNTITDVGSDRLITFNVSGTLTVGG